MRRQLRERSEKAVATADGLLRVAHARVFDRIAPDGAIDPARLDTEQLAVPGFAWMATYVEALRQLRAWAARLDQSGAFGEHEALILKEAFGEDLGRHAGGIPKAQ